MSKRKAYNPRKQLARVAGHLIKNILVCYTDSLKGCVMYDRKQKVLIKPTQAMVASLDFPYKWSCFIAAFGRNQFDEYMKSEQIITQSKYKQADLAQVFEQHHEKLIKTMPEPQLCGVGWIADPFGGELTEKEAGKIFEKLEAWQ